MNEKNEKNDSWEYTGIGNAYRKEVSPEIQSRMPEIDWGRRRWNEIIDHMVWIGIAILFLVGGLILLTGMR